MLKNISCLIPVVLILSACGFELQPGSFLDQDQNRVLMSAPYGSVLDHKKKNALFILASKQDVLNALRKLATKHGYEYTLIWNRRSACVEYTVEKKLYKLKVHAASNSELNENSSSVLPDYALLEVEEHKVVPPFLKKQLTELLHKDLTLNTPHKHINAKASVWLPVAVVKSKLDAFFQKLYPKSDLKVLTKQGKVYTSLFVKRNSRPIREDHILYTVKTAEVDNHSTIYLHLASTYYDSSKNIEPLIKLSSREQSQLLLDKIIKKLNW